MIPIENIFCFFLNSFFFLGVSLVRNDASFIGAAYNLIECNEVIQSTDPFDVKKMKPLKEKRTLLQLKYDTLRTKKYECAGTAYVTFMYADGRNSCMNGLRTYSKRTLFRKM